MSPETPPPSFPLTAQSALLRGLRIIESPLWTSSITIVKATGAEVIPAGRDADGLSLQEVRAGAKAAAAAGKGAGSGGRQC